METLPPYIKPCSMPHLPDVPQSSNSDVTEGRFRASYKVNPIDTSRIAQRPSAVQSSLGSMIANSNGRYHRPNSEGGIKNTIERRQGAQTHGVSLPTRETLPDAPIRESKALDVTGNLPECIELVKQLNYPHRRASKAAKAEIVRDIYADSIQAINLCTNCYLPVKMRSVQIAYLLNDCGAPMDVIKPLVKGMMKAEWLEIKSDSKAVRNLRIRRTPLDAEGNPYRVHNFHGKRARDKDNKLLSDSEGKPIYDIKPGKKDFPLDITGLKKHIRRRTHSYYDVSFHYRPVSINGRFYVAFFNGNTEDGIPVRALQVNGVTRFYKVVKGAGPGELFIPPVISTYRVIESRCTCPTGTKVKF